MNIIVVFDRLAKGRTVAIGTLQASALLAFLAVIPVFLALLLYYWTLTGGPKDFFTPYLQQIASLAQRQEAEQSRTFMQQNVNAMAVTLGQLQAQMLRLNSLGERVAKLAGMKKENHFSSQELGQGGAETNYPQRDLSPEEFSLQIEKLTRGIEDSGDQLAILESMLLQQHWKQEALPTAAPVTTGWYTSDFGWRIDPFNGRQAFHEGVDFTAPSGTPILAAAGGIVVYSDFHAGYGNMVEIDHGNGVTSRYGHASRRLVKAGDIIMRGQKIAEVGNSGRSSGPHLHFEVRHNGVAQNPSRYLNMGG
ncbi:MAG: M23 family metallopeptidase [Burkholderiales bacterium]